MTSHFFQTIHFRKCVDGNKAFHNLFLWDCGDLSSPMSSPNHRWNFIEGSGGDLPNGILKSLQDVCAGKFCHLCKSFINTCVRIMEDLIQ
jgi:hypothetical protein